MVVRHTCDRVCRRGSEDSDASSLPGGRCAGHAQPGRDSNGAVFKSIHLGGGWSRNAAPGCLRLLNARCRLLRLLHHRCLCDRAPSLEVAQRIPRRLHHLLKPGELVRHRFHGYVLRSSIYISRHLLLKTGGFQLRRQREDDRRGLKKGLPQTRRLWIPIITITLSAVSQLIETSQFT
jgi:hypothetical protein